MKKVIKYLILAIIGVGLISGTYFVNSKYQEKKIIERRTRMCNLVGATNDCNPTIEK